MGVKPYKLMSQILKTNMELNQVIPVSIKDVTDNGKLLTVLGIHICCLLVEIKS